MPLEEAVGKAIEDCVRDNILRDFLLKQRAEVFKMSIYEYDEERELKLMRADEREIGIELGKEEERENTEKERENAIKAVISLCQEFGSTKEVTIEKLLEKCELSREMAEEKINRYWK